MSGNQNDVDANPPIRREADPPSDPVHPETADGAMRPDDDPPPSPESGGAPDGTGGAQTTDDSGIHLSTEGAENTAAAPSGDGDAEPAESPDMPETGEAPPQSLDDALEGSLDVTLLKLDAIQAQMDRLQRDFESKIKYDAHKAQVIDQLHQELQEYKSDLIRRQLQPTIVDVIKVIDDIRKLTQHYRSLDQAEQDPRKLLNLLENIPSDLEDLLFYQGVEAFVCDGTTFDPARQRILQKIDTPDAAMDKTIAARLRPGYLWNGTILRPELVTVYVHQPPAPTDT